MQSTITLEEAIRRARLSVQIDEKMVTIERMAVAPDTAVGQYAVDNLEADENAGLSFDAKFWRDRCETMYQERQQVDEVVGKLQSVLEKYAALREYTKLLESKLGGVDTAAVAAAAAAGAVAAAKAAAAADEERAADASKICAYEMLTAMTLQCQGQGGQVQGGLGLFLCTLKNKEQRRATRFEVEFMHGEMRFKPRANVDFLPPYLRGEILCDSHMGPVMLSDALQTLFAEEREEREEREREEGDENQAPMNITQ